MGAEQLFDATYYLEQNPDVAAAGVDAYTHYINTGWREGRDPSAFFDTDFYLNLYSDVAAAGVNPLEHYAYTGFTEGRNPSALFDTNFYLSTYQDVANAGVNPLQHFMNQGVSESRDPNAFFDTSYYLTLNPDVAAAGVNPYLHYLQQGYTEGRDPSAFFDTSFYLNTYQDVANAGVNPLIHFLNQGLIEQRDPNASTDISALAAADADLLAAIQAGDRTAAINEIEATATAQNDAASAALSGSSGGSGGSSGGGSTPPPAVSFTLTAGTDNISGAGNNNTINATAATLNAADTISAGGGTDTISITGGGTVDLSSGATITSVEAVSVADANGTTITLGTYNGSVTGGSAADTFNVAVSELTTADTINGAGDTDTLNLTGGSATFDASTVLANVSAVENITFAAATTMTGGTTTNYNITGSTGNDTFLYAAGELTSADTVDGNGGASDVLSITGTGSVDISGVTDIDSVTLAGATAVTIDDINVAITGSTAGDEFIIDESNFTGGNDSFSGGTGTDIVTINDADSSGITVNGTQLDGVKVEGIDTVKIGGSGTNSLTLIDAFVEASDSDNLTVNLNGNNLATLTTTGVTDTVTLTGTGGETVALGNGGNAGIAVASGYSANITGGTGADEVTFNDGADSFTIAEAANLDGTDSIVGGTGTDSITLNDGGANGTTITGGVFDADGSNGGVSSFETINFGAIGGGSLAATLTDGYVMTTTSNAVTLNIGTNDLSSLTTTGVTGTVTVDSSDNAFSLAMADGVDHAGVRIADGETTTITLGNGANTITGGTGVETFSVAAAELTSADSLTGAAGSDILNLSSDAAIATGDLANLSGIDVLNLGVSNSTGIALSDVFVNASDSDTVAISATGASTLTDLDTSNVAAARSVVIATGNAVSLVDGANSTVTALAGVDVSIAGGSGNDTVKSTEAGFTAGDSIDGGTGTDILNITDAANITSAELANVTNVETLDLDGATNTVVLNEAFIDAQDGAGADNAGDITIDYGSNALSLDASAATGTETVTLNGSGAVTLTAGADLLVADQAVDYNITAAAGSNSIDVDSGANLDGNDTITATAGGSDTLVFGSATGAINFGTISGVTGFETLSFGATGNGTITLTDTLVDSTAADTLTVTTAAAGHTLTLDTSAVNVARTVQIADGVITLGTNDDRVVVTDAAPSINGGNGEDRIIFTEADDLATGDSINGGGDTDAIIVTTDTTVALNIANGNDLNDVAGVEFLALTGGAGTEDVASTITVDGTSEINFLVNDGTMALTSTATAGDVTVMSSGLVTVTDGDAVTLADVSGTVAHTANDAWGASSEIGTLITNYTGGSATLAGAAGTVIGGSGADSINAVAGTAATISVEGGTGADTITIDTDSFADATVIKGGSDTDTIVFTNAVDVTGDAAADANKDSIEVLKLGANANTIVLAAGEADNISDSGTGALTINTDGYTITSLELADGLVTLTGGDNTGTANVTATLTGGASDFTVNGISTLTLFTGANHDITGGATSVNGGVDTWSILETDFEGTDTLDGGFGSDILIVNESGGDGTDVVDADFTNVSNIETVRLGTVSGGQTSSFVFGNNADTAIGAGNSLTFDINGQEQAGLTVDTSDLDANRTLILQDNGGTATVTLLNGSAVSIADGTDGSITGSASADSITGGNGADTFSGGADADTLTGGAGNDSLTGGDGNDFFVFAEASDTKITDMDDGAGTDRIVLSDAAFTFTSDEGTKSGGALTDNVDIYDTGSNFSAGDQSATTATFIYDRTDGELYYDADGAGGGTAVLIATIQNYFGGGFGGNNYVYDASDFIGGA